MVSWVRVQKCRVSIPLEIFSPAIFFCSSMLLPTWMYVGNPIMAVPTRTCLAKQVIWKVLCPWRTFGACCAAGTCIGAAEEGRAFTWCICCGNSSHRVKSQVIQIKRWIADCTIQSHPVRILAVPLPCGRCIHATGVRFHLWSITGRNCFQVSSFWSCAIRV